MKSIFLRELLWRKSIILILILLLLTLKQCIKQKKKHDNFQFLAKHTRISFGTVNKINNIDISFKNEPSKDLMNNFS